MTHAVTCRHPPDRRTSRKNSGRIAYLRSRIPPFEKLLVNLPLAKQRFILHEPSEKTLQLDTRLVGKPLGRLGAVPAGLHRIEFFSDPSRRAADRPVPRLRGQGFPAMRRSARSDRCSERSPAMRSAIFSGKPRRANSPR